MIQVSRLNSGKALRIKKETVRQKGLKLQEQNHEDVWGDL